MSPVLDFDSRRNALIASEPAERRQILFQLPVTADPEMVALMADYLGDPAPAVCEAAVEALVRCGNSVAAEAAALHLRSSEPAERGNALDALIGLGRQALPSLIRLLGDPDHNQRKFAADAMGSIRAPECLPVLVTAMRSSDPLVAAAAAEALGALGDLAAVPALQAAVAQGPDWLRLAALASLGRIGGEAALECICHISPNASEYVKAAAVSAISQVAEPNPAPVYEFLVSLLEAHNPVLEDAMVMALGHLVEQTDGSRAPRGDLNSPRQPFIPILQAALSSGDYQVRAAAAAGLGAEDSLETGPLLPLLADDEAVVRLAALKALAFHSALSLAELANLAFDDRQAEAVRITALHLAADSLRGQIPLEGPVRDGLIRLARPGSETGLRVAALRPLLISGAEEGVASAIALLAEEDLANDDAVRTELALCPADLLLPVAAQGLRDSDSEVRLQVFTAIFRPDRALDFTKRPDGRALVIAALEDADWPMRLHALSLVGQCADQAWARQILRRECDSSDDRVRVRAVEAIGSSAGAPADLAMLTVHLSDANDRVRAAAWRAIARLGQLEEAVLRRALLDPYPPIQQIALSALLASDQHSNSRPLCSLAQQIASSSPDPEIVQLGQELARKSALC